ncbi:OmpA family protein, partial [Kineosporia sp. R_H_3]|uniref:OmpA family protein n=1 Tax=Kineosporia sp. R_H_3 TaxID=1961848 RepID=UPI001E29FCCE
AAVRDFLEPAVVDVAADLVVNGAGPKRVLTLSGTLAGETRHAALLAALRSWAPKTRVDDNLVVVPDAQPAPDVARAWPTFLRLAGRAASGLTDRGRLHIGPDGLKVSGLTSSEAAATAMGDLADEADARGIAVRSTVTGPVTQVRARLGAVKGLRGVSFTHGSERLTAGSKKSLTAAAKIIKAMPAGVIVEIEGFTDNKGDAKLNQRLSQRRANEVKKFLVSKGVPAKRLSAEGLGEKKPKASNTTAKGRAANRRIEFVVKEG